MARDERRSGLRGRRRECDALDDLVDSVRAGRSRVLVLRGEAGIGKSTLLEYAAEHAAECRITRVVAHESEMELAYAGLHQVCSPMLDDIDRIPAPQRLALATAFGLATGDPPDRFFVGLAVLSLISEAAEQQPVLCLVDDAQWLDQASAITLAFVARRLLAERVGVVFAVREGVEAPVLVGLPELAIDGLGEADARALLEAGVPTRPDPAVVDRIIGEAGGNPLALLELPRSMTAPELAGGFGSPAPMPVAGRLEDSFTRRIAELPRPTQRLLVLAAADPVGDPVVVWRAAARLGIPADAAAPATSEGLLQIGRHVLFRHSLVRTAAYRRATTAERQEAHSALAAATDAELDPDRRAWHRALATPGPDEDVAAELERSADRAQARGGMAAAAALLERATALTPDPARRTTRSLVAAGAHLEAGASDAFHALLAAAEAGPLDELSRVRIDLFRGRSEFTWGDGRIAATLLLSAAKRLEAIDVRAARRTYHHALGTVIATSHLTVGTTVMEVARAVRAAPAPADPERAFDLLLDGLAMVTTDGPAAAAPVLRRVLSAVRQGQLAADELFGLELGASTMLWDHESWRACARHYVQVLRDAGALMHLPLVLDGLAVVEIFTGELSTAASLVAEAGSIVEAAGSRFVSYAAARLASWRGPATEAEAIIDAVLDQALAHGLGMAAKIAHSARATLCNGLGRYDEALIAAREGDRDPPFWATHLTLHELVEAAIRCGERAVAAEALERLAATTQPSGTDWALGVEARARALLATGDAAEALYRGAIDRLDKSSVQTEAARAHLLFGEWLRRENHPLDAREHLRIAHESFLAMGANIFVDRAARELAATGAPVRQHPVEARQELSAQEAQIARLAADGRTNHEIGATVFLGTRTIEWHLGKIYTKLGITSRRQLRQALPELQRVGNPTANAAS